VARRGRQFKSAGRSTDKEAPWPSPPLLRRPPAKLSSDAPIWGLSKAVPVKEEIHNEEGKKSGEKKRRKKAATKSDQEKSGRDGPPSIISRK
jgi:hypothetical protein